MLLFPARLGRTGLASGAKLGPNEFGGGRKQSWKWLIICARREKDEKKSWRRSARNSFPASGRVLSRQLDVTRAEPSQRIELN